MSFRTRFGISKQMLKGGKRKIFINLLFAVIFCITLLQPVIAEPLPYASPSVSPSPSPTPTVNLGKLFNQAKERFDNADYWTAIDLLKKVIEIKPESAASHYWLGRSHQLLGKYYEAEEAFNNCLKYCTNSLELCKMAQNEVDKVTEAIKELEAKNPKIIPTPTPEEKITLTPQETFSLWQSPVVPITLSFVCPGAGQVYRGGWFNITRGILYAGAFGVCYWQMQDNLNNNNVDIATYWLYGLIAVSAISPIDAILGSIFK